MAAKPKVPGPDHPITIEPSSSRVVVSVAGRVVADTREALTLRESTYPAVLYIPRKDVDMSLLERTKHATYCPYKGDCAYYSIGASPAPNFLPVSRSHKQSQCGWGNDHVFDYKTYSVDTLLVGAGALRPGRRQVIRRQTGPGRRQVFRRQTCAGGRRATA